MSKFLRAMKILEGIDLPLFDRMRAESRAYPISIETANAVRHYADLGRRRTVNGAVRLLIRSKRYLEACAAEGAQRWNLAGEPTGPVSPSHRVWAQTKLKEIAGAEAKRLRNLQRAVDDRPPAGGGDPDGAPGGQPKRQDRGDGAADLSAAGGH